MVKAGTKKRKKKASRDWPANVVVTKVPSYKEQAEALSDRIEKVLALIASKHYVIRIPGADVTERIYRELKANETMPHNWIPTLSFLHRYKFKVTAEATLNEKALVLQKELGETGLILALRAH